MAMRLQGVLAGLTIAALVAVGPAPAQENSRQFIQKYETETLNSEIAIAPEALAEPGLGLDLVRASLHSTARLAETAAEDAEANPEFFRRYSIAQNWVLEMELPGFLSLQGTMWMYTGGAHGNVEYGTILWSQDAGGEVPITALFEAGGPDAPVWQVLSDDLYERWMAEWSERAGEPLDPADDSWQQGARTTLAPKPESFSAFLLLPSDVADKAGGLRFIYAPYALGPYAAGAFEFEVPHAVFDEYLTADWRARFGGEIGASLGTDE